MGRPVQQPVSTVKGDETITKHPAYGQITVHRTQGAVNLYGSDFTHHGFVSIAISLSESHRSLSRDWHFQKGEIVEVWLSEAQWATFVSSFNLGSGVPCTISHLNGETIPALPERKTFRLYAEETHAKWRDSIEGLKKLEGEVTAATSKLSKKAQDEVLAAVRRARMELESNLPFVKKSFDEHIEESVEKAKVEVNAYMMNAVREAGLKVLSGVVPEPPLLLEEKKS